MGGSCARRLDDPFTWYQHAQRVALDLRHEIVCNRTTVGMQLLERDPRIRFHRCQYIARLISHRFQRGTRAMILARTSRQPQNRAMQVTAPIASIEACKSRNKLDPFAELVAFGTNLRIAHVLMHQQAVAQSLDNRSRDKDAACERVLDYAIDVPCGRREQPMLRRHRLVARIHEHEAAGTAGGLRHTRLEASLTE